ncbi:nucleotidyltransferase [Chelativorans sp.]|uniref:nucleotidyltransferase n=1 Tax=Chelativorans sp. TaxID=2203393 RepID=UPI0028114E11|nr:nucleotidyltransferase [Chelativorans sp.]
MAPSGSFAKGTAVWTGTDLDLFISLHHNTPEPLHTVHEKLFRWMSAEQLDPRPKNTAIGIRYAGFEIDLVPGKRQSPTTANHSLFRKKTGTWKMTDVVKHVQLVRSSGLLDEIRLFKIWRDQLRLEFPSFYLEMMLMGALPLPFLIPCLERRLTYALAYIRDNIMTLRVVDPANTNNVLSDDLTVPEKQAIRDAASDAHDSKYWGDFVK